MDRFTEVGTPPVQVTPDHSGEQGLLLGVHPERLAADQLSTVTLLLSTAKSAATREKGQESDKWKLKERKIQV